MRKLLVFVAVAQLFGLSVVMAQVAVVPSDANQPAVVGDVSPASGRVMLTKLGPSVVSVRTITKTTMAMEGRESSKDDSESESTGVVVNAEGLTAVSLTGIDPSSLYNDLMGRAGGGSSFSVQSDITDIKIHFGDGTEVSGEVAIRDRDLDLAFVRPKTKLAKPVPFIDLTDATDADILDPVVAVSRFGKQNRWEMVASVEHVQAVLTKPRRMYLVESLSGQLGSVLGSLAFSPKGKVLGVELLRKVPSTGKDRPQLLLVVLPAKELLAVAKQVEAGDGTAAASPVPASKPAKTVASKPVAKVAPKSGNPKP